MFQSQVTRLTDFLVEKELCKVEDKELVVHGLCGGIELIFNIITTFVLGMAFGMVIKSFVFLIFYSFIRTYAGGYHCKKALHCYCVSSFVVVAVLIAVRVTPVFYMVRINFAMLLISIPVILKFAPVGTPTKMLEAEETEYFRKKVRRNLLVECVAIAILLYFEMYDYAYVVGLGVFVSAMLVLLGWYVNEVSVEN